jgi:hypothetical protein
VCDEEGKREVVDELLLWMNCFLFFCTLSGMPLEASQMTTEASELLLWSTPHLSKKSFPRRKNMQALAQHGLTIADAKNEILGLVVGDYYKGPKQDFDPNRPGDIWEFKKNIDGMQFYVKVKIVQENGEDILKCLAFHEDDFA